MRAAHILTIGGLLLLGGIASAAGDDTEQLIKYYRKKANVAPSMKVAVTGLHDSAIKGVKEGTVELGDGQAVRKVSFTASPDLRYAAFASVEDVSVDPSKAVMQKIDLKGQPGKGPVDAKVTIVEYSDFQCPFCSRAFNTMDKQVLKDYGDKVRFYYKHYPLPFHPFAKPAAIAAECAKQQRPEAFWKLYSDFFENQGQMTPENVKEKSTEFLQGTGIDMAKWNDCFDNKRSAPAVDAQMAEGTSVGVTGTPGFIINGRLVSGAQPYENFKNIIDDELAARK